MRNIIRKNMEYIVRDCFFDHKIQLGAYIISDIRAPFEESECVVSGENYHVVSNLLMDKGIYAHYTLLNGLMYHTSLDEIMEPVELNDSAKQISGDKELIIYVGRNCDEYMYAAAVKARAAGYEVCLVSTIQDEAKCSRYEDVFDHIERFSTINGIVEYIENSSPYIVHCMYEDGTLFGSINYLPVPVVCQMGDLKEAVEDFSTESLVLEYIANEYSAGNIYTTAKGYDIAKNRYNIKVPVLAYDVIDKSLNTDESIVEFYSRVKEVYRTNANEQCM